MPALQKPLYERVTGAAADSSVELSAVPEGKSRFVFALSAYHSAAAALAIQLILSLDSSRFVSLAHSANGFHSGALNPGLVPPGESFPCMRVPILLNSGQYIWATAGVGAGETITVMALYYEWYHDYESVPWQVHLL